MYTKSAPSKKRTHYLLEEVASETKVWKGTTRMELARELNEKTKMLTKKRKQQERIRNLMMQLESTEAQIEIFKKEIQKLKALEKEGSPASDE